VTLKISCDDEDGYVIEWVEGYKRTTWAVGRREDVTEVLRDILKTVEPNHVPHSPLFLQGVTAPLSVSPVPKVDKASLMEEQRLMNGGAALGRGLPFDGVPIMDDNALLSAPTPEGWKAVNYDAQ
jgi:hypothetical protein